MRSTRLGCWLFLSLLGTIPLVGNGQACGAEPAAAVAAEVDRLLAEELGLTDERAASRCSDDVFVRRAYLDLVGRPPTARELSAFSLDHSDDTRTRLVDSLLESERFGQNWARYWRDVIFYRRSEDRALIASQPMTQWLAEQFNQNVSWDRIATEMITASGDVREVGSAGLIMAQGGQPEETVAEISRIFLGIQIQCAQCHDHPTDRWTREEFHQLAAFFPRVAVRPTRDGDVRSFAVVASDATRSFRPGNNRFFGTAEHRMPDLDNPSARGKLMQPVLFATGQSLNYGIRDEQRRGTLARWLTANQNEWFAKAFVNRVWAELVGEGFYNPVDDMGPDRDCSAPDTFAYLATSFAESQYDVKWLYATIMATEAYQRASRSRGEPSETPFEANCPQRLRGDQLLDALTTALDLPRNSGPGRGSRGPGFRGGFRGGLGQLFGYDPSERRDEISGTVQQTLALMNSPLINGAITGSRFSGLGRLLAQHSDDSRVATEIYLRTLSREPSEGELRTCLSHVEQVGSRREAFEDIQWALINSTEFLHRR